MSCGRERATSARSSPPTFCHREPNPRQERSTKRGASEEAPNSEYATPSQHSKRHKRRERVKYFRPPQRPFCVVPAAACVAQDKAAACHGSSPCLSTTAFSPALRQALFGDQLALSDQVSAPICKAVLLLLPFSLDSSLTHATCCPHFLGLVGWRWTGQCTVAKNQRGHTASSF